MIFDHSSCSSVIKKSILFNFQNSNDNYCLCLDLLIYTQTDKDYNQMLNLKSNDMTNFENKDFIDWCSRLFNKSSLSFSSFRFEFNSIFSHSKIYIIVLPKYIYKANSIYSTHSKLKID